MSSDCDMDNIGDGIELEVIPESPKSILRHDLDGSLTDFEVFLCYPALS